MIEFEIILAAVRDRDLVTPSQLRKLGHSETRVDRALQYGVRAGVVERLSRGHYRITPEGSARLDAGLFAASDGGPVRDRRPEWRESYLAWVELQRAIGIDHDLELPGAEADPSRMRGGAAG